MTHREAYLVKEAINLLISVTDKDRYCVAVAERLVSTKENDGDYELHLYLRDPEKAGLIELAMLARVIEDMGTHFMTVESTYDAGTETGEDIRHSIKIW